MSDAQSIDPKLLEMLVCPLTKGPLRYDHERQELVSEQPRLAYPIRDGIPIMLVEEARRAALDEQQAGILSVRNQAYVGQRTEVLVEDKQRGRWRGRTRTNKLVFFDDADDWRGKLANVKIDWAGPWHMRGEVRA